MLGKLTSLLAFVTRRHFGDGVRGLLASRLKARHTPLIEFHYDSQFESEKKIDALLNSDNEKSGH